MREGRVDPPPPRVIEEGSPLELTPPQRGSLAADGYVLLPGIVPRAAVEAALHAINRSLGSDGLPPERLTQYSAQSYCPPLQGSPLIAGLFNDSPLRSVCESVIGSGSIRPVRGGQIALRFPNTDSPRTPGAHIDGMYTPTNGVAQGTIANFTALVGVFLSDVPTADAGNFTVWPGSHRLHEAYFRERGPQSLLQGMPRVDMPEPRQITARAGDAVLCHYLLGHGVAANASPHIRYAIFFRLTHVDHDSMKWESMTDMWRQWPGMQEAAAPRV